MGLLSKFFNQIKLRYIYGIQGSKAAPFGRDLYEQETVRAIIDCIASHAAKAEAMHVVIDKDGRVKEIKRNSPYVKLLNQRPNDIMTGFDLKYKLVTQLEAYTTALCYVRWKNAVPDAMIPIDYRSFEILPVNGGGYAVKFSTSGGSTYVLNAEDVVILRKFYNSREVSGDGNAPIYNTLDMVKASDEGFIEALSVSNKVRGLLRQKKAMLGPDDVERNTEEFTRRFQEAAQKGGIVGIDSMEDYTPLNVNAWAANSSQMREVRENLLRYWRVSEPILTSDYTESQWQAFYESVIEPLLIQMGQAFTAACFTQTERDYGNRIIFSTSVLLNTSIQTKVNLIQSTKEIGLFSPNEMRELFGYAPVEGGDEHVFSLNYIKESNMSKYQTGQDPEEGANNGKEPAPGSDDPEV